MKNLCCGKYTYKKFPGLGLYSNVFKKIIKTNLNEEAIKALLDE